MPVRWRPKRMMTTPAIRASSDLYCTSTCPTSVEIAPSVIKTMLKPMMKAAELSITFRKSSPSFSFNCSTPTPEINETYPGTSGSTQGDKDEISPATKTASGNGKLVIISIVATYCIDVLIAVKGAPARLNHCGLSTRCLQPWNCYSNSG